MKQPGTLVRHDDREYLLVEGGFNAESRAVILLARLDDPRFPRHAEVTPLRWGHQGEWQPVARWTEDELRIPDERHGLQRALAQTLIDDYRAAAPPRPVVAWAARRNDSYVGRLETALPMGFAALCHEDREALAALAAAATPAGGTGAAEPAPPVELVPVENLAMFFTHLVREGYAGAVWNGTRPVFFCVDDAQDLQFLRVGTTRKGDHVVMEVLDARDRWADYEGEKELEFIDNSEACDARLVECLGRRPLMGWPADGRLFAAGPEFGVPLVIQSGGAEAAAGAAGAQDAVPHALLFTTEAAATEFIQEAGEGEELTVFAVNDLDKFLTQPELAGSVAALNPGGHRASAGILWSDGDRVVLDSFSGFWKLGPGGFELLE